MSNSRKKMTDKDKKLLWGKAAGRCSICHKLLINTEDSDNIGVITGVEAHIIGHSKNGPRGDSDLPLNKRHLYENMILLCSEHAKTIDERTDFWSIDKLKETKKQHEKLMSELKSPNKRISPKLKLVEPTGKSTGGPQGHYHKFTVRNFGKGEALNINFWIRGWGFKSEILDTKNRSYLDEKEKIELDLRVDGTPLHTKEIPFLKFYATYQNLDDELIRYQSNLIQIINPSGETYNTKIANKDNYELISGEVGIDSIEILPSMGDYSQALYKCGTHSFKIKVSRTLLACWGIQDDYLWDCFYDLGVANISLMSKLDAFQDKEYSTYSFPETNKSGLDRFIEAIEFINNGEYETE